MKQFLLLPILLAAVASVRGASLVEGRIYLKNGSVIECVGDDRLQLPKRFGKLTILRDAFRKTKAKEIFQSGEIDSVVCWHAQSPEHIRKFIPAESPGWMWVYLETPHICVCIYSEKGYGIDSNGGIQVWQRQGTFSQSRTAYYLKKTGEKEFLTVGAANRNTKDVFRERIARYVGDDPNLPNVYGCRAPSAAKPYSCCAITIRRNIDSTYKFKHYETVFTLYCNCVGHVRQHFPG